MGLYFFFGSIAGIVAGIALGSWLGPRRLAAVPALACGLCACAGSVAILFALFNATAPSFARHITIVGKALDCTEESAGRLSIFHFHMKSDDGNLVYLGTHLDIPPMCWRTAEYDPEEVYRVVYLDDVRRNPVHEAIEVEVLRGRNKGWHKALDARPLGLWLLAPLGGLLLCLGLYASRTPSQERKPGVREIPSHE
jgi:hypothetical protein